MEKNRLEAFSDGVIAIIITIMVLEMKAPTGTTPAALVPVLPVFLSYLLSFVYVGIYWNNHHHLLQMAERVDGKILWANLHLLFWLSLVPFVTAWMGQNHYRPWPAALYGTVLLLSGTAYLILQQAIIARHGGRESRLARAIGRDLKGKLSFVAYLAALPLAFVTTWISLAIYVALAAVWLIPDRRIEANLGPE
jgi:uncharacterized membrane protein